MSAHMGIRTTKHTHTKLKENFTECNSMRRVTLALECSKALPCFASVTIKQINMKPMAELLK